MFTQSLTRRDLLKTLPVLALLGIKGHGSSDNTRKASIERDDLAPNESEAVKAPSSNRVMHRINPTLSSSLPSIAAEFYEARVLIDNNFVKHTRDSHSSEDALRYDNADVFSRPWAGLIVHLGALLARSPANSLAASFTDSKQMQSRFASMFSYYTIVGEVKYLRNPILSELRDLVQAELKKDPTKYKNDPRNIPLVTLVKNLCERRKDLGKVSANSSKSSARELNLKRSAIDLMIFGMSISLGLKLNASSGRSLGSVVGTGCVLRDIVARELDKGTNPDELSKLRHRTRAEMITWPALFTFNAILQNIVHAYIPKLFPEDNLAQEHLVEMIGNLSQAGVYCVGKTRAQSQLEMASELGSQDIWKIIDWYIQG